MARRSEKKSHGKRLSLFREKPLRGRAARLDFLLDLANAAKITIEDARSALDGMRAVVCRNLRGPKSSSRIPRLVRLRVQILPVRDSFTKIIKGKTCVWKARQHATKKIVGSPLKPLSDAMA